MYVYPTEMKANFKGYAEITPYQLFESTKNSIYSYFTLLTYLSTVDDARELLGDGRVQRHDDDGVAWFGFGFAFAFGFGLGFGLGFGFVLGLGLGLEQG